jgi:signal transduction histidine kinase
MKTDRSETSAAVLEYEPRQLVSDLFHQLSQPLTTLCCSLELAPLQAPTAKEYGEIISRALGQAERVSWFATAIRELFDAGQAGENPEALELRQAVQDAVGDLLPVAASAGIEICYLSGPVCPVWFDAHRLRQGLFHLLGFAVDSSKNGAVVKIALEEHGGKIAMTITISGLDKTISRADEKDLQAALKQRLGVGIARAIFEAAGGNFNLERKPDGLSLSVQLLGAKRDRQMELRDSSSCFRLDR